MFVNLADLEDDPDDGSLAMKLMLQAVNVIVGGELGEAPSLTQLGLSEGDMPCGRVGVCERACMRTREGAGVFQDWRAK